jgi:cytochrome c-type biogenesis protein CcmE
VTASDLGVTEIAHPPIRAAGVDTLPAGYYGFRYGNPMSAENADVRPMDPPPTTIAAYAAPAAAARRKKFRAGRWIGLGMLAVVIALVASTIRQGSFTYSKYVDEVLANPRRFAGMEIRVEGVVLPGSIESQPGSRDLRFRIERNQRSMPVQYTGVVPDTFRDGIGVTVRGRLGAGGVFTANELVAKCPSRYEMQAARARGAAMPPGMPSRLPTP